MPEETVPGYEGQSMALHTREGDHSPVTEGPPSDVPVYTGQSPKITSHVDSPPQWLDESIIGPMMPSPSYWGRSQAIHVFGVNSTPTPTPPTPIPSCRCCAEAGAPTEPIPSIGPTGSFDDLDGWKLVFVDEFNDRTIAEGHFMDGSSGNRTSDGRYFVYPEPWHDTSSHGHYSQDYISVHDGLLDIHLKTTTGFDGTWPRVATLTCLPPGGTSEGGILGGRMHLRIRADLMLHFKGVPLWWADNSSTNNDLMKWGEIDCPESSFDDPPKLFVHRTDSATLSDQYSAQVPAGVTWQAFHDYVVEWIPGVSVTAWVDGVLFGQTTERIPNTPMHFNLQFETALGGEPSPSPSTEGHVQIEYVAMWVPEGTPTTAEPVGPIDAPEPTTGDCIDDCVESEPLVTQHVSNRISAYTRQIQRTRVVGIDTPSDFSTTIGSTGQAARVGGFNSSEDDLQSETAYRLFFTHSAPVGATYARLKTQMEGWYGYGSYITGYLDSIPLDFLLRQGSWGATVPVWGDGEGPGIASGVIPVGESGLPVVYPGAPQVDVVVPVVDGLVQWVVEIPIYQTTFTGRKIDITHEVLAVPRYPEIPVDREYFPEIFMRTPGNTLGIGTGVNYDLEFFDSGGSPCNACADCADPDIPGSYLPDFTPGFMPTFRKQIGDPTTSLDSFICTLESAAMVLDWHTRGAISVWGGELIPWCGKTEAQIAGTGTSLNNARLAWLHYGQILDVRSGQTWSDLVDCLQEGRAVILQGDYGVFTLAERCQDSFEGNHAISVYPYQVNDRYLIGDPLCSDFTGMRILTLKNYAEALGREVFGTQQNQPILFAVSRPWTP